MKIGKKEIKDFSIPYIIAEIGANHNGDMDLAKEMIDSAKSCGCDAVKFQSWTPESLIAKEEYDNNQKYDDDPKRHFGSLKEMVEKYYLRSDQHVELRKYCDDAGINFISTAFSPEEVDLLEDINVDCHKIASMDVNNLELLKYVAKTNKPIILSTGMSTFSEIENAVNTIEKQGNKQVILLHCIAVYPPEYKDINLNNIHMLREKFGHPVGFSDHTIGTSIPLASVALGVCMIEKHFTIDKDLPGWDHTISANPEEMKIIVDESKNVAKSLGVYERVIGQAEEDKKIKFRRSIVAKTDLEKGHVISLADLTFKRPGTGVPPDQCEDIVGRRLNRHVTQDELVRWDDID